MADGVFARPLSTSTLDGRFESWEYAPLYSELAPYFFTHGFLDSHSFAFLESDPRQIGFCAVEREDTYIDGRIVLDSEGAVASVDWVYATPDPDEGAGGRVEFDAESRPLPSTGVFWRRLAAGDFQEWTEDYSTWSVERAP